MRSGILITGGSGLLAVNWAAEVKHRYAITLGLHSRHVVMDGVVSREINMESTDGVASAIRDAGAAIVVHSAAKTNVDACEAEPEIAHHVNVEIARNVARACKLHSTKLIHISTDHVFSGTRSLVDERADIGPINVYAQTKAAAETAVLDACPNAIVARTNFFGWGLPYRKSFSDMIIDTLRAGNEIGLFRDAYFTPILMERLIHAAHELIEADAEGIFHVVGDERVSKYEFGLRIAKKFGLDATLIKPTSLTERRDLVPRPLDLSLDNQKMRRVIGRAIGDLNSQLTQLLACESRSPVLEALR